MSTLPPDREIYIAATPLEEVIRWLEIRFGPALKSGKAGKKQWKLLLACNERELPAWIIEDAGPGFTSLWFDSPDTPWSSDQELAREAFLHFQQEVRASAGSWNEGDDPDEWWCIDGSGERLIHWG